MAECKATSLKLPAQRRGKPTIRSMAQALRIVWRWTLKGWNSRPPRLGEAEPGSRLSSWSAKLLAHGAAWWNGASPDWP